MTRRRFGWAHSAISPTLSSTVPTKRMRTTDLRLYLHRCSEAKQEFILNSQQCGLLIEALQRVALWLSRWEKVPLLPSFVQYLLTLAMKGWRLLELCQHVEPASWLFIASSKLESKEEFFQLFQGFLQALGGYVEVMQGPTPGQNSNGGQLPSSTTPSVDFNKGCVDEATSLIASLNDNLHFLQFKAAEDRRAIYKRLEQRTFSKGEEAKVSRFLMERLEDKHKYAAALQLDMQGIRMGKQIEGGNFGAVHEAMWMGMHVAVKQFMYQACLDAELRALLKTDHVNVIHALGYVPEAGGVKPCLVMERMKGDLGQFVKTLQTTRSELPLSVTVEILLQVACGMAHLHTQNIVHRDLKPANILFDRWPPVSTGELNKMPGDFTAKVTDFGDCRMLTYNTEEATAKRGTGHYRAPEVLRGIENGKSRYSNKADVYSYGMVCYKLLTGSDPCLPLDKAKQGDLSELGWRNTPRALIFFMKKCCTRAHQKRPSFEEICDFLYLFKSILLNTRPIDGHMPPLNLGLTPYLLERLVAFLGNEWLMQEAIALGVGPIFREGAHSRIEINEGLLQVEVLNKLAALPDRRFSRWICWCA